jgi:hypothetical protein
VDLDPDNANTYIELTYDSGDANPDLLNAGGLTFSPDGTVLYIGNGKDNAESRVFVFDNVLPPAPPAGTIVTLK